MIREFIYQWFYDGSPVEINGQTFKLHRREIVSREFYVRQGYGRELLALIAQAASHFQSFIDIGANIGLISVQASRVFHKPILAIEPVSSNHTLLMENIRLNSLSSQIQTVNAAAGEQAGEQTIYLSKRNFGDHRLAQARHEQRIEETIQIDTVDHLIARDTRLAPPYLVKLDVQGYECKALAGADHLLRSPCLVIAEFWPYGLSLAGDSAACFESLRRRYNLTAYEIVKAEPFSLFKVDNLEMFADTMPTQGYEGSCDIVLTNLPLDQTGL